MIELNFKRTRALISNKLVKLIKYASNDPNFNEEVGPVVDETELILMLTKGDIPYWNINFKRINPIEFIKVYSQYSDSERRNIIDLILRKYESEKIIKRMKENNLDTCISCVQSVSNIDTSALDDENTSIEIETKLNFFINGTQNNECSIYEMKFNKVEYTPAADGRLLEKGDILSEFNVNYSEFQELYFRVNDSLADKIANQYFVPRLNSSMSNINTIKNYWEESIKEEKEVNLEQGYSLFEGEKDALKAHPTDLITELNGTPKHIQKLKIKQHEPKREDIKFILYH